MYVCPVIHPQSAVHLQQALRQNFNTLDVFLKSDSNQLNYPSFIREKLLQGRKIEPLAVQSKTYQKMSPG
jgi:hypothetical protein